MSIESKLRGAGLNFEIANLPGTIMHGGLKGVFELDNGRSHVFVVSTEADDYLGVSDHDVLCPIKVGATAADVMAAASAMACKRRGGIVLANGILYVRMDMPSDLSGEFMAGQILGLCLIADELEQTLFDSDDL
jgi:hypothetical protein